MRIENKEVVVRTPGTCGELVQGRINNQNLLITCPVNLFSYCNISKSKNVIHINDKWKSQKAALELLNKLDHKNTGLDIQIHSEIPVGKGMASSTADMVSLCVGITELLEKNITDRELAKLLVSIEPTDGIMYQGIVLFDYLKGEVVKQFGPAPEMKILAIDTGDPVDTIQFNQNDFKKIRQCQEKEIEKAIGLVEQGLKENNYYLLGEGSTLSARLNQQVLYKQELEAIINISNNMNAYGVCVAHSGSMIGVLLPNDFKEMDVLKKMIITKLDRLYSFYDLQLINGGYWVEECY